MRNLIAKVFTTNAGSGIELEFESRESELVFWHFISRLDQTEISDRILQLEPIKKE